MTKPTQQRILPRMEEGTVVYVLPNYIVRVGIVSLGIQTSRVPYLVYQIVNKNTGLVEAEDTRYPFAIGKAQFYDALLDELDGVLVDIKDTTVDQFEKILNNDKDVKPH